MYRIKTIPSLFVFLNVTTTLLQNLILELNEYPTKLWLSVRSRNVHLDEKLTVLFNSEKQNNNQFVEFNFCAW